MKYKNYTCIPTYSNAEKVYYGCVEGVPEIGDIEATTLDEFETAFHKAVDDYLLARKAVNVKIKWGPIVALVITVGLLIAMMVSCPKKSSHTEVLADRITSVINDEMGDDSVILALSSLFGGSISKYVVNNCVDVKDYVLFSIGKYEYEGKSNTVSFGILGHVFTVSKERLKKELEQNGLL